MDVNDIVCVGLGSWSSVNSMPTLGYGMSSAVLVPGIEYAVPGDRLHFTVPGDRAHFTVGEE
jgi:hypothetical protein